MHKSGQMIAQKEHPVHPLFLSKNTAGVAPFLLIIPSCTMHAFGQYKTQNPHPLHFSFSMSTLGM